MFITRLSYAYLSTAQRLRAAVLRHRVLKMVALLVGLSAGAFYFISFSQPTPSYLLLDRHGYFLAELGNAEQGYGYWPVEQLPPRVVAATLALEDRRFAWHPGVDPIAVGRAVYSNVTQQTRVSGASTLAMQVARMQSPGPRNYWRKVTEAGRALVLTLKYGQQAILQQYLRLVPYGNNIHGIAYAARRYLDKPVEDLSWAEIAFLAAIPQSPTQMNPYRENGRLRAIQRGKRILQVLHAQQVLNRADYELAVAQIQTLHMRLCQCAIRRRFMQRLSCKHCSKISRRSRAKSLIAFSQH